MPIEDRKITKQPFAGIIRLGVQVNKLWKEKNNVKGYKEVIEEPDYLPGTTELSDWGKLNGPIRFVIDNKNVKHEIINEKDQFFEVRIQEGVKKGEYATATDWFVVDHLPEVVEAYGKRPLQLSVLLLSDDPDKIISADYKCYKGGMLYCVGTGKTAKRQSDNGEWHELDYCKCAYFNGAPAIEIPRSEELEMSGSEEKGNYVKLDDIWRKVDKMTKEKIMVKQLEPSCTFKMEVKIILPNARGILPYVIRSQSWNNYSYIRGILENIKYGNTEEEDTSGGLGFLRGVPFILKKAKEKQKKLEDGKYSTKVFSVVHLNADFVIAEIQARQKEMQQRGKSLEAPKDSQPEKTVLDPSKEVKPQGDLY